MINASKLTTMSMESVFCWKCENFINKEKYKFALPPLDKEAPVKSEGQTKAQGTEQKSTKPQKQKTHSTALLPSNREAPATSKGLKRPKEQSRV